MTIEPPFEVTPRMQELSELMHLREITSQVFPDSELQPVRLDAPTDTLDDPLISFADQYFGYGRPQVPLEYALQELTKRGYTGMQVAYFLIKKSMPTQIDALMARYRTPREEIKKMLHEAIGQLLTSNELLALRMGMMLGSYAALGISPDTPEFPGQMPLE